MHLAIDIREACREQRTGKGQWVFGFVCELLTRDVQLTLLTDSPLPPDWEFYGAHEFTVSYRRGFLWHWNVALFLLTRWKIDYYISPTSFIVPWIVGSSVKCIPVVHDMIAFLPGKHSVKARTLEKLTLPRVLRCAHHIFTASQSAKTDLLAHFPSIDASHVTPIFAGSSNRTLPERTDKKFIFCPATLSPRKNQLRLLESYAELPNDLRAEYKLILAGSRGWNDSDIVELANFTDGVEYMGHVSDSLYQHLLSECTVLALPSFYEGFGLQILDALQMGVPILTTKRGALPEVVGDAAVFVNPEDSSDITRGLQEILTNPGLRAELSAKGPSQAAQFNWKRTVDLALQSL